MLFLLLGSCLMLPGTAFADAGRGRLLYENHCQSCHASTVHVRDQRKVTNPAALQGMIQRWSDQLKLNWQDTERADVYQHLNNRYYRFAPESKP
jgi:hypothetical protein